MHFKLALLSLAVALAGLCEGVDETMPKTMANVGYSSDVDVYYFMMGSEMGYLTAKEKDSSVYFFAVNPDSPKTGYIYCKDESEEKFATLLRESLKKDMPALPNSMESDHLASYAYAMCLKHDHMTEKRPSTRLDKGFLDKLIQAMNGDFQLIHPSTNWCGSGFRKVEGSVLPPVRNPTDACCYAHDHCRSTGTKFLGFITTSWCECDFNFYNCLLNLNTGLSIEVADMFFNTLGLSCYNYVNTDTIQACKPVDQVDPVEGTLCQDDQATHEGTNHKLYEGGFKMPIKSFNITVPVTDPGTGITTDTVITIPKMTLVLPDKVMNFNRIKFPAVLNPIDTVYKGDDPVVDSPADPISITGSYDVKCRVVLYSLPFLQGDSHVHNNRNGTLQKPGKVIPTDISFTAQSISISDNCIAELYAKKDFLGPKRVVTGAVRALKNARTQELTPETYASVRLYGIVVAPDVSVDPPTPTSPPIVPPPVVDGAHSDTQVGVILGSLIMVLLLSVTIACIAYSYYSKSKEAPVEKLEAASTVMLGKYE